METMKDSGIAWIGQIPKTWEVKRLGNFFRERNEKVSDYEWEPLSVTKQGIVKQLESAAKSDAHNDRKKVCKNDFVINSRSDRKQSCGVSPFDGSVSLINIVLENHNLEPEYVEYLLKNYGFAEEFYRWGTGIVADLWSTKWERMKKIMLPVPQDNIEQTRIAHILDEKLYEIEEVLEKTRKTIEDYKKYRQAVITEVVTKGLNPEAKMKDSGVKWIGEIPENWKIQKLKNIFSFGKGLPITKDDLEENGIAVISYGQIHSKKNTTISVDKSLIRYVNERYLQSNKSSLVNIDDFIFADTSEDLLGCGNCVRKDVDEFLFAGYHSIILHARKPKYSKYLAYLFQTDCWRSQIRCRVSGIKLFSITQSILRENTIILPEEKDIEDLTVYLDNKCKEIDKLITQKENLIEELEAYKKSIIYEYVTGKKEVCK